MVNGTYIDFTKFNSLFKLAEYFADDDVCRNAIIESRWGKGDEQDVVCPYCGHHHCNTVKGGRFYCPECNKKFSCLVGTIFENTKVSLRKWFLGMYLISSHKKGVSSHQLSRDINVTQKTAWYMLQKIRTLYVQDDSVALSGDIELDEVYIGGKEKWKHKSMRTPKTQGRSTKTKTPVFGMMERSYFTNAKGHRELMTVVKAFVVEKTDGATLVPIVKQFCEDGAHLITDELNSYNSLSKEGFIHDVVCHSGEEFVRENIFTNNMEGFWSHFRRMITGCYHNITDKYLQRYVDEACYRWNTRKQAESDRFRQMFVASIGICDYRDVRMETRVS